MSGAAALRSPRQFVRAALGVLLPRRLFLLSAPRAGGAVHLTFDDGPHPDHTPRTLDTLRELKVPATFFVIGERAERYPQLVRRATEEGHRIGHHSWTHAEPSRTSPAALVAEAERGRQLVREVATVDSCLFRPPKGEIGAAKLWRLWRGGFTVVLWDNDPKDYLARGPEDVVREFSMHPLRPGTIVLLHDSHPHAAAALPEMAAQARALGLRFDVL